MTANPVVVEVVRGDRVESRHRGAVAVVDRRGDVVFAAGDIDAPIYPRSSLKPIQSLALVESGAADRFGLGPAHMCLACASHGGESAHTGRVAEWLQAIGLDQEHLECGAHEPTNLAARDELMRSGRAPGRIHNNCSGKHTGFLSVARHMGIATAGYIEPGHPVQRLVTAVVEECCSIDLSTATPAVDGCGIPVWGLPLRNLAAGFAGVSGAAAGGGVRDRARARLVDGILAHPLLIAGSGRFCTRVIANGRGAAIVKTGAEAVFSGCLLKRGLGIALKIDDGATRASEVLMAALLSHFADDPSFAEALRAEAALPLFNAAGARVGGIGVAGSLFGG